MFKIVLILFATYFAGCFQTEDTCQNIDFGHVDHTKSFENATVPKIIWTFWDKGEANMPGFHRFNVENWRLKLEPLGYKIVVTNLVNGDVNNARTILGNDRLLPDFLDSFEDRAFYPNQSRMNVAVIQSDFVRLALLEKFGGIWMDATNVLVKDIDDLVTPGFIKSPQSIAGYSMAKYTSSHSTRVNDISVDGFENWLIIAKEHSPIIQAWRKALIAYWRDKKPLQPIAENPMFSCKAFDFGQLGPNNYLNAHVALKYTLFKIPELGHQIYPLDFNPWWLHEKSEELETGNDELYKAIVGSHRQALVEKALEENVIFLKFSSSHIPLLMSKFPKAEDFCNTENFFSLLYQSTMRSRSWCEVRK